MRRGIVVASTGAVLGGALGSVAGFVAHQRLLPVLGAQGSALAEVPGTLTSLMLVGAGVGLALGCSLALRVRHHHAALVTTVVLLAVLPFAAPLVALGARLHWMAGPGVGVAIVVGVIAVIRLVVTRIDTAEVRDPLPRPGAR